MAVNAEGSGLIPREQVEEESHRLPRPIRALLDKLRQEHLHEGDVKKHGLTGIDYLGKKSRVVDDSERTPRNAWLD